MKCYYTGEDCDCGADMDGQCVHDGDDNLDDEDYSELLETEVRFSEMQERLDAGQ